jgi:hypothetical protein
LNVSTFSPPFAPRAWNADFDLEHEGGFFVLLATEEWLLERAERVLSKRFPGRARYIAGVREHPSRILLG